MTDSSKDQLLEIYKLHAELADRVSQRREGANRLHVSLLSGFLVFLAALLRFGSGEIPYIRASAVFRDHRHGHIRILVYCDSFLPTTQ